MPKPRKGEPKDKFISRCIAQKVKEGVEQDQAVAICFSQWQNRAKKSGVEFKSFDFEVKSYDKIGENLIIEGYGAKFDNVDSYNDVIVKGAFKKTLVENKGRIAFCYQHDIYHPIGLINDIKEDNEGLWVSVMISESEEDIATKIQEGILKEMSIGYQTMVAEYDENTEIRTIREVKLWEVSLVTIAANPEALIHNMKSMEEKRDYVTEQIEKLIAIENNREKKFELLKLKSLIEALPNDSQEQKEPVFNIEEFKNVFSEILNEK